jgi:probable rRNA maturation factor
MYNINIQHIADKALAPKAALLRKWAQTALAKKTEQAEITLRLVDVAEMTKLNSVYRMKTDATNVLSFPFTMPDEITDEIPYLGDIVICSDIVNKEAEEQKKKSEAHWAHMVVHGVFHLLGYDHETDQQAQIMETLEIQTLQDLGFTNPYLIGDNNTYHG